MVHPCTPPHCLLAAPPSPPLPCLQVIAAKEYPSVFSISYGWWDLDNCDPSVFPQASPPPF